MLRDVAEMSWLDKLPFRLGTTSYIIPADILPNLRYLAGKVRDVELVLFDVDEYCNIPTASQVAEMKVIGSANDLSYTVHLPLDLNFSETETSLSIEKALKVIRAMEPLDPFAYVCHLDSRNLSAGEMDKENWLFAREAAVQQILSRADVGKKLCIENLENYPAEWNLPIIRRMGVSACSDVGHLWLEKREIDELSPEWAELTRVIHLHGIGSRDHQSLIHTKPQTLRGLLSRLCEWDYRGVVTLEVFNEADFNSSIELIRLWDETR